MCRTAMLVRHRTLRYPGFSAALCQSGTAVQRRELDALQEISSCPQYSRCLRPAPVERARSIATRRRCRSQGWPPCPVPAKELLSSERRGARARQPVLGDVRQLCHRAAAGGDEVLARADSRERRAQRIPAFEAHWEAARAAGGRARPMSRIRAPDATYSRARPRPWPTSPTAQRCRLVPEPSPREDGAARLEDHRDLPAALLGARQMRSMWAIISSAAKPAPPESSWRLAASWGRRP